MIALQGIFPSRSLMVPGAEGIGLAAATGLDPFLGEMALFAGNFAPRGWAFAQGQILSINQNQALFSLLGTTFGGDGRTTFALPDLRGRTPVGTGQGPGFNDVRLGQRFGAENLFLTAANLPSHGHTIERMAPVPLPAPALMLLGGLAGLGAVRARRRG